MKRRNPIVHLMIDRKKSTKVHNDKRKHHNKYKCRLPIKEDE